MHVLSIHLSDEEYKALEKYAILNGASMSKVLKQAFFEKIEDEFDRKTFDEALVNFAKDSVTYTNEEVMEEFGLSIGSH